MNVNSKLVYYGELLSAGEMKAAYGSFLSALLVIYEHDKLADKFANYYNVTVPISVLFHIKVPTICSIML